MSLRGGDCCALMSNGMTKMTRQKVAMWEIRVEDRMMISEALKVRSEDLKGALLGGEREGHIYTYGKNKAKSLFKVK